ncbi:hypothetical protein N8T08_011086 [Aspergillus melleus]|uniref:Uncharacterized protein n=1 Tax=Aspergillus melleus TaxID=138277 RepID=A0ACC3AQV4_9EURO|nr:hypothetical protein N8T08_011086 [Aspergillus melleus]
MTPNEEYGGPGGTQSTHSEDGSYVKALSAYCGRSETSEGGRYVVRGMHTSWANVGRQLLTPLGPFGCPFSYHLSWSFEARQDSTITSRMERITVDELVINARQRKKYQGALAQLQLARDTREALGYQLSVIDGLSREAARHPGRNAFAITLAYNTAVDALVNPIVIINENIPPMDQFMPEFANASPHCKALMGHRERLRCLRNDIGHQRRTTADPYKIIVAGKTAYDITGTPTSQVMADLTRVIDLYDSYGNEKRVLPTRQKHDAFDFMPGR